jgi:glutathione peroxidase
VLLIVNVASECGFTPQYAGLEDLHRHYQPHGFAVLGFPCNQFGAQESGGADEIRTFCERSLGVSFPLFAKIDVNGPREHPLYHHLKQARPGALGTKAIKWNFTKFRVGRDGTVVGALCADGQARSAGDSDRSLAGIVWCGMPDSKSDLINLRNLGPFGVRWLCGAGISTLAELRRPRPRGGLWSGVVARREGGEP